MSEEQVVLEEITPPAEAAPETPAAPNNPPEEPPKPEPAPETTKAKEPPAPTVPPAAAAAAPTPPVPIEKGIWPPQMQPAIALIEKLIAMGGEAGSIAQQVKAVLKQAGDPPPVAKAMSKTELGRLITGEVQKQLESALKAVPTLRKGLVSQEPEASDVRKTFESLSPEKKLRVALALQQQA